MSSCISDSALFYKLLGQELIGMSATCMDDTLHIGNEKYFDFCYKTEKTFTCEEREWNKLQFAGVQIETKEK